MPIIRHAKIIHIRVLVSNMLSFKKIYVKIPNITFDTPNPTNFADQSWPVSMTIFLMACQKHKPRGTENTMLEKSALSAHHDHTN